MNEHLHVLPNFFATTLKVAAQCRHIKSEHLLSSVYEGNFFGKKTLLSLLANSHIPSLNVLNTAPFEPTKKAGPNVYFVSELPKLSLSKTHTFDETIRRIERGARLVCVVPDGTQVILQTPRGNLEVFHPRALVLFLVRSLLDGQVYVLLFAICRDFVIFVKKIMFYCPDV